MPYNYYGMMFAATPGQRRVPAEVAAEVGSPRHPLQLQAEELSFALARLVMCLGIRSPNRSVNNIVVERHAEFHSQKNYHSTLNIKLSSINMPTMRALVTIPGGSAAVQEIDIPTPGEGEILVKVHCAAQNPTDWKAMQRTPPGRIIGCDFAGTVEDPNGSNWRKGQRVAGFVHGTWDNPKRGCFAEYCVTEADEVYEIPQQIPYDEAAAIPLAFATAVQAMIQRLNIPEVSKPAKSAFPFFVNGGTSSVGKYAIQLGKLGGLFVVASGSKKNHALLKDLGADACVDYNDADWPAQVRKLTHDGLQHAFDCIAEGGSQGKTGEAMSPTKGGHIVTLLPVSKAEVTNSKVKIESTIVYTVFGRELRYGAFDNCGDPRPEDKAMWVKYLAMLPELLSSKKIRANRIKDVDGGLDGMLKGFEDHMAGKVSAEKLVYKIT